MYYQKYLAEEITPVPGQKGIPGEQDPMMSEMQSRQAAAQTQPGVPPQAQ